MATLTIARTNTHTVEMSRHLLNRPTNGGVPSWLVQISVNGRCEWLRLYGMDISLIEDAIGHPFDHNKSICLTDTMTVTVATIRPATYHQQAVYMGIDSIH